MLPLFLPPITIIRSTLRAKSTAEFCRSCVALHIVLKTLRFLDFFSNMSIILLNLNCEKVVCTTTPIFSTTCSFWADSSSSMIIPSLFAHKLMLLTSGWFFSPKITKVIPSSITDFASCCAFFTCGHVASTTCNPFSSASS